MHRMDIRRLQRDGLLTPGRAFGWQWTVCGKEVASIQIRTEVDRVILNYRNRSNGGEWQTDGIPGAAGMDGLQAWGAIVLGSFARRKDAGGAWRLCSAAQSSLAGIVTSWPMSASGKLMMIERLRRAGTIRRRLGWQAGIANPTGDKPKGMHWQTFWRLKAEHDAFANASWAGMAERLGLLSRRLSGIECNLNGDG
jgi:hypothetical protein